MSEHHATAGLGGPRKPSPKQPHKSHKERIREIRLRKGKSGGYIAEHHLYHELSSPAEPEEHAVASLADLHKHLDGVDQDFGPASSDEPTAQRDPLAGLARE